MSDRQRLDEALASVVDVVQNGNICCGGCYGIQEPAVTFAYYTTQDVEQSFSADGERAYGNRVRYSSWDDEDGEDEDDSEEYPNPFAPDAATLVAPLYVGYGMRDDKVFTKAKCTRIRKAIVKALTEAGFTAEDPGTNDERIKVTGVTDTRVFA